MVEPAIVHLLNHLAAELPSKFVCVFSQTWLLSSSARVVSF